MAARLLGTFGAFEAVARIIAARAALSCLGVGRAYDPVVSKGPPLNLHPRTVVVLGYLIYSLVGWALLCLPWSAESDIRSLDHLFTSVSAVSTTGLVTESTTRYSGFGQLVILLLIQLGALGYMTMSSFVLLARSEHLPRWRTEVSRTTFGIPSKFAVGEFIRAVVIFSVICETVGACVLYPMFADAGSDQPLWDAIFHSVSAFGTAGFSVRPEGATIFATHYGGSLTLAALSYAGAIGFIVWVDLYFRFRGRSHNLTFTSKIILRFSIFIAVGGTLLLSAVEPSLADLPAHERVLQAFFQTMTATTTVGFNSVDIGGLAPWSLLFLLALMVFGASPSGTGGGLKLTTLSALYANVHSTLKSRSSVRFWKREVPQPRLQAAHAALSYFFVVWLVSTFLLMLTTDADPMALMFESASALGTVGISMGVTGDLTPLSRFVVIVLMFIGRIGVLTFGLVTAFQDETREEESDNELIL